MRLSNKAKGLADSKFISSREDISVIHLSIIKRLKQLPRNRNRNLEIAKQVIRQAEELVRARVNSYVDAFKMDGQVPDEADISEINSELESIVRDVMKKPPVNLPASLKHKLKEVTPLALQDLLQATSNFNHEQRRNSNGQHAPAQEKSTKVQIERPQRRSIGQFISENKHWIFEGIGVQVTVALIGGAFALGGYWFFRNPENISETTNSQSRVSNKHSSNSSEQLGETFRSYMQGAYEAFNLADYSEAERLFRAALSEAEKRNAEDKISSDRLILALNGLSKALDKAEKYEEADGVNRRLIEIMEKARGEDDPEYAIALNNWGLNLSHLGRFREAEAIHRRALTLRERYRGAQHSDVAVSLINLGKVYYDEERYSEAEELTRRSLRILKNIPHSIRDEDENEMIAMATTNLGLIFSRRANNKEAETQFIDAIEIIKNLKGDGHPDMVYYLQGYSEFLRKMQRIAEATEIEAHIEDIKTGNIERKIKEIPDFR